MVWFNTIQFTNIAGMNYDIWIFIYGRYSS